MPIRLFVLILSSVIIALPVLAQDADNDGVPDTTDNCPSYWNPEQYDADGDGIGNVCDECTDSDGDGFGDPGFPANTCPEDNCPVHPNPVQLDSDGDGDGDACEGLPCGDINGDGLGMDIADITALVTHVFQGGPAPASSWAANTGGCNGFNIFDLTYTLGCWMGSPVLNCDGPIECPPSYEGAVWLEVASGLYAPDSIAAVEQVTFYLRLTNDLDHRVYGLTHGFHVYSPTGATWTEVTCSPTLALSGFDWASQIRTFGVTGEGSDTVALAYLAWQENGMETGFDTVSHEITIGPIPTAYSGGEICIDSCWFPPIGDWMWGLCHLNGETPVVPSWGGPHCFTIYDCCQIRSDINHDGIGPDIADLVHLVSYMFQYGPPPTCEQPVGSGYYAEADINDDGVAPDIADLVYLVTYMFQPPAPAPVPCP